MDKKVQAALFFVLAVFIFLIGSKYGEKILNPKEDQALEIVVPSPGSSEENQGTSSPKKADAENPKEIYVHVSGAVKNPGLYKLASDARVNDAIEVASPLSKADINQLNLAQKLSDGQKVIVPAKGEEPEIQVNSAAQSVQSTDAVSPSSASGNASDGKVNINTASVQELDTLPGIGPAYAERIIQYRNEHGPFQKIEEIQEVQGIGPKKLESMKERISVN